MKPFSSLPWLIIVLAIVTACYDGPTTKNHDINTIPFMPGVSGKGGSMARFTIADSALYVVTNNHLQTYSIANSQEPVLINDEYIAWDLETIFRYDTLLFIGSQSAMYVYDIRNQFEVQFISSYWHATACDPVVFDGTYAYVTLNSENITCGRFTNELQIIDMKDITNPVLRQTREMDSPKGLGVDGDLLFVCDGNKVKIYSKTNPLSMTLEKEYTMHNAYDVIPYNGLLIATAKSGIYQYSYNTNTFEITELSQILIE